MPHELKDQIQNKLGLKPRCRTKNIHTNSLKDQIQNKLGLKPIGSSFNSVDKYP